MTSIKVPKAFRDFVAFYALDALEFDEMTTDDRGALIENALQYLPKATERAQLHDFPAQVLETRADNERLAALWSNSGPMLVYNKEAYRAFFTEICDRLRERS